MTTLAAVVVTFNRLEQLKLTVERLRAEAPDHIVVVDNASTDDTPAWLAGQTGLHVVSLPENTGGAGGFEAGMAAARDAFDPAWVVLMDDDARPSLGCFAAFRAAPEFAQTAPLAVAAAVTFPDGEICEMNRPGWNPFWHMGKLLRTVFKGTRQGFKVTDAALAADAAPTQIDVASFVGYFVNRAAVQVAGLPDGSLFIYGDDVLYSLRLRRKGAKMVLLPQVRMEHDCKTMGTQFIYRPLWKVYYHCRNGVEIARMSAGIFVFPLALCYYLLTWLRKARYYPDALRPLYKELLWKGVRDGLMGRRGRNDEIHLRAKVAEAALDA